MINAGMTVVFDCGSSVEVTALLAYLATQAGVTVKVQGLKVTATLAVPNWRRPED